MSIAARRWIKSRSNLSPNVGRSGVSTHPYRTHHIVYKPVHINRTTLRAYEIRDAPVELRQERETLHVMLDSLRATAGDPGSRMRLQPSS
jgi:hypothetical protein